MAENFTGYDAWKTRAPEDERGYWDGREPDDNQCPECGCDGNCSDLSSEKLNTAYNDGWNDALKQVAKMAAELEAK